MSDPVFLDHPQPPFDNIIDTISPVFSSSPESDRQVSHETSQDTTPTSTPAHTISPDAGQSFTCTFAGCHKNFISSKDLARHIDTHDKRLLEINCREPAPLGIYRCMCGKRNPRPDNHKRHAKSCAAKPRRGRLFGTCYQCYCGHEHVHLGDHLAHLEDKVHGCGKPRGRPPSARGPPLSARVPSLT